MKRYSCRLLNREFNEDPGGAWIHHDDRLLRWLTEYALYLDESNPKRAREVRAFMLPAIEQIAADRGAVQPVTLADAHNDAKSWCRACEGSRWHFSGGRVKCVVCEPP